MSPVAEGLADIPSGPCPATATEFDGSPMRCVRPAGHTEMHTDGCVEWADPWGEIDAEQHPEPWRRAYEDFCAAMDWTGDDPRAPQLFPREDG